MRDTWCKRRVRVTFKDIRKQITANEKNKKQNLKENKRIKKTNRNERLKKGNKCYRSRVEGKIRANVTKNKKKLYQLISGKVCSSQKPL